MLTKLFNYLSICVAISLSTIAYSQVQNAQSIKKLQMNVSDVDFTKVDESVKKDLELKGGLALNFYYEGSDAAKGSLFKRNWSEISSVLSLNMKEGTNLIIELWVIKDLNNANEKVGVENFVVDSMDVKEANLELPLDEEGKLGTISLKLNFNDQAIQYTKDVQVKDSTNTFVRQQTQNTTDGSLVYVYIYTDSCPWCVRIKSEVQKLKQFLMGTQLGNVYQVKYTGQSEYVSLGVRSFPTILVYRNGSLIDRIVGYRTWEVLRTNAVDNVNK